VLFFSFQAFWNPYPLNAGMLGTVQLLVARGADANRRNVFGQVPLHHACQVTFVYVGCVLTAS
jgi:hypothetical protein